MIRRARGLGGRAAIDTRPALALVLVLLALAATRADAYPRMYLESGAPCATCHVAPQGGGTRNTLGWYTASRTGLVTLPKSMPESSAFADGAVWSSGDFRFQMARVGRPTEMKPLPDQRFFPMQTQVNLAVAPRDWLTIVGGVNFIGFDPTRRYAGQAPGEAAIQIAPKASLPVVRAGLIQPSIGVRPEDHTLLVRANAADPRRPFIPPSYVEPGLELSYHPISWLQVEGGIFANHYLQQTVSNLDANVAWLLRLMFLPQILDAGIHTWLGASAYGSGTFLMANAFAGIGIKGKVSLQAELAETQFDISKKSRAWALIAGVTPKPWLHVAARIEQGTAAVTDRRFETWQAVFGVQFTPVPFLEVRPEYRYLVTDTYRLGQYTLQLYAYY